MNNKAFPKSTKVKQFVILSMVALSFTLLFSSCSSNKKATVGAGLDKSKKVELPANFPTDFPKPSSGKLLEAHQDMDSESNVVYYATWEVTSSSQSIINSYQQKFKANNWQISKVTSGGVPEITFRRSGAPSNSHLAVVDSNGKRLLQVIVY